MGLRPRVVIDIGSRHLKVVVGLDRGSASARVSYCDVSQIADLSDEIIARRLKEMLKAAKIPRGSEVIGMIPRQSAIVRFLELPSSDLKEIAQMVELQAFQKVPFTRTESVVDFTITGEVNGYTQVMVVIVPREIFMQHWSIYAKAGISPDCVTMSSLGTAAWAGLSVWAANVNAIFDVDDAVSDICISQGGRFLTGRQILSLADTDPGKRAADLVQQLELTLSSYEKQHLGAPVVKMLFLASADMAQQLSLEGKGILRHAFEVISLTENVVAAKNFKWPKIVLEGRASVLAACGLALAASMPAIRLLDLDIRDTRDRSALISGALRACVLLVVALGVLGLALSFPLFQKNSGLNALDEELKGLNSIVTKVQAKGDQIAVIEDLLDQRIMFSHVIKELYGLIPSDLILSNFSIAADGQMSMEGYSADRDMVDAFQKAMGQAALFKDVKLEYINKRIMPVGEVNYFGITCRMADVHAKTK